jgi:photosystem II stability/assembly factor-like uncharacterized protein
VTALRKLGIVLVALMVAGDVVLVYLAVRHVGGDSAPLADVVATPWPTPTKTLPPSPDPKPTAKPRRTPPSAERVLVDIGAGRAMSRAVVGACGKGGGAVELSPDGGRTFSRASLPGADVILRVASTDADDAYVVATDEECADVTTYVTTNGGADWDPVDGSEGSWHRLAKAGDQIHAPSGTVNVPCAGSTTVRGFSTLSTYQAYALCTDGMVLATDDGGESWSERGELEGATDLDFVSEGRGLAVVMGRRSCAGIAVLATGDGGESWESRACVETSELGMPDISADGDRAYIGLGKRVWYSADRGATWGQRSRT